MHLPTVRHTGRSWREMHTPCSTTMGYPPCSVTRAARSPTSSSRASLEHVPPFLSCAACSRRSKSCLFGCAARSNRWKCYFSADNHGENLPSLQSYFFGCVPRFPRYFSGTRQRQRSLLYSLFRDSRNRCPPHVTRGQEKPRECTPLCAIYPSVRTASRRSASRPAGEAVP